MIPNHFKHRENNGRGSAKKAAQENPSASLLPRADTPAATPAVSTAPASKPAPSATPASGGSTAGTPSTPAAKPAAHTQPPPANSAGMVWVNTDSGIYHKPGTRWYGRTKEGKYMTEGDVQKAGYRAAEKE